MAGLAAAVAIPLLRRKLKIPAAVTATALAAGPPSLAVVGRRTRLRDAGMYALQMWMFTMGHELPYDDPDAARRRLRVRYPIRADRFLGGGELPNVRIQRALAGLGRRNAIDRFLSWVHWSWFLEPHGALTWILARHPEHFAALGAADVGGLRPRLRHLHGGAHGAPVVGLRGGLTPTRRSGGSWWRSGEEEWGKAWPALYDTLGGNPWAAMPSLHFATSLMAALLLAEAGPAEGALGWTYAGGTGLSPGLPRRALRGRPARRGRDRGRGSPR